MALLSEQGTAPDLPSDSLSLYSRHSPPGLEVLTAFWGSDLVGTLQPVILGALGILRTSHANLVKVCVAARSEVPNTCAVRGSTVVAFFVPGPTVRAEFGASVTYIF